MNTFLRATILAASVAATATAGAATTGDLGSGGVVTDSVSTNDGWILDVATDGGVDFWSLTVAEEIPYTISVTSDISFGISVYEGTVGDDFLGEIEFDNDGDFDGGTFVAGTSSLFPDPESSLEVLLGAGLYTVAVGGDSSGFAMGPFDYELSVAPVPLPGAVWLLGSAGLGLLAARRRKVA